MKIIDNFVDPESHRIIKDTMMSNNFPWFIASSTADNQGTIQEKELAHLFHDDMTITSNYWNIIVPIIEKINPRSLLRIRAALMSPGEQNEDSGWHTDYDFNGHTTAVYYVNSNNGYTLFEDGTRVESVANRFVFFDSHLKHTGVRQNDTSFRCLINFNYF